MKRYLMFCLMGASVTLWTCKKDKDEDSIVPEEPEIAFVRLSTTEVEEFNNAITLTISYKDYQGDLGFANPDLYALEVKDSRLDSADRYHIPPLAPTGVNLVIEGHLDIELYSMFVLGNGDEEIANLTIRLSDRAGNWSNVITSPNITIKARP